MLSLERQMIAEKTPGWLADGEGELLHEYGLIAGGPLLEVGAYCGKSSVWLGAAAEATGQVLYSVDHHLGSVEMQPGRENHQVFLIGPAGVHDTVTHWHSTIIDARLTRSVVGVVAPSDVAAERWWVRLGLVFIDAGHDYTSCRADYDLWSGHITPGGYLLFHDCTIPDIAQVTREAEGDGWRMVRQHETLWVLQR